MAQTLCAPREIWNELGSSCWYIMGRTASTVELWHTRYSVPCWASRSNQARTHKSGQFCCCGLNSKSCAGGRPYVVSISSRRLATDLVEAVVSHSLARELFCRVGSGVMVRRFPAVRCSRILRCWSTWSIKTKQTKPWTWNVGSPPLL